MTNAVFKNCFTLPNEIFYLGLSPGAIAAYSYLLSIENRKTYQCHVSYKTMGKRIGMTENTVRKYVRELEDRQLIYTEPTTVTVNGEARNGSLLYTIRPIREAVDSYNARQMELARIDRLRQKVIATA